MDLVKELPEEKLGKVISFIKFIKQEEEPILVLESEDEEEIAQILVNNEWYSDSEISKMIEDME
ncbi:MAG TPA: hypothetical protein DHV55_11440 [Clostridiaceae bacterium]|nr:hypothetical protein [Clostridiaceae bacterium]